MKYWRFSLFLFLFSTAKVNFENRFPFFNMYTKMRYQQFIGNCGTCKVKGSFLYQRNTLFSLSSSSFSFSLHPFLLHARLHNTYSFFFFVLSLISLLLHTHFKPGCLLGNSKKIARPSGRACTLKLLNMHSYVRYTV